MACLLSSWEWTSCKTQVCRFLSPMVSLITKQIKSWVARKRRLVWCNYWSFLLSDLSLLAMCLQFPSCDRLFLRETILLSTLRTLTSCYHETVLHFTKQLRVRSSESPTSLRGCIFFYWHHPRLFLNCSNILSSIPAFLIVIVAVTAAGTSVQVT